MITKKQWYSISQKDKLSLIKDVANISDKELSSLLGIRQENLIKWAEDKIAMSKVTMDKLYILYVLKIKQGPSDNDNIFLALNTIGYDSSKEIFTKTFREGDALQKCVALHSICAKLSYVIMEASESGNYPIIPVIHAHTIFGTNEPGEMLNISCISKKLNINSKCNIDEKVDICISIVNLNEEPEAVYIIDFINDKGQAVRREEGIISDYSLIIITKSILEYFSNHTYINKL